MKKNCNLDAQQGSETCTLYIQIRMVAKVIRRLFFFKDKETGKSRRTQLTRILRSYQKLQPRLCYWQQNGKTEDYHSAGLLGSLGRFAAAQKEAPPLFESYYCDRDRWQPFLSREENFSY